MLSLFNVLLNNIDAFLLYANYIHLHNHDCVFGVHTFLSIFMYL